MPPCGGRNDGNAAMPDAKVSRGCDLKMPIAIGRFASSPYNDPFVKHGGVASAEELRQGSTRAEYAIRTCRDARQKNRTQNPTHQGIPNPGCESAAKRLIHTLFLLAKAVAVAELAGV